MSPNISARRGDVAFVLVWCWEALVTLGLVGWAESRGKREDGQDSKTDGLHVGGCKDLICLKLSNNVVAGIDV